MTRIRYSSLLVGAVIVAVAILLHHPTNKLDLVQPGDTVVITGTSTGIGKHAALSLAKEGYTVFACVRKTVDGDALLESARKHEINTENIKIMILDVTNSEHIARGVEIVSEYVGDRGLKGLFNNAGISHDLGPGDKSLSVEFSSMEKYRWVFNVNFFGLVETTKAFLGLLMKGKGRIVMNSSVAGFMASPFMSVYASSKHAVEGFSDSLRRELLPHGVKVSVLECSFITTPILNKFLVLPEGAHPYKELERTFWKALYKSSIGAPTPKVSSEAVIHAMRAAEPKVRYVVGKDSAFLKMVRYIPAGWLDFVLTSSNGREEIGEEELKELLEERETMEFEL